MDLQEKIAARRRERQQEAALELAQKKQADLQKEKEAEQLRASVLAEAIEQTRTPVGSVSAPSAGLPDHQLDANRASLTEKEAQKILDDEAGKRVGWVSQLIALALICLGLYDIIVTSWAGLLWIGIALAFIAYRIHAEKQKLLGREGD